MLRSTALLALTALIAWHAPTAHATVARPLTYENLTHEADVVIHGVVVDQKSFWGAKRERIYTHTEVSVWRTLKGKTDQTTLVVRQWGGAAEGAVMPIPGNAQLKVGEEVVLFLTRDARHHFVVGLSQGKFSLRADAAGGKLAYRDLSGLTFARWSPQGKMTLTKRWALDQPISLDDLESAIKRANTAR